MTIPLAFDLPSILHSSCFCSLDPVFGVYSACYLILLICTFLWCKTGAKNNYHKRGWCSEVAPKIAGEEWGEDVAGNNKNSISFQPSHCQRDSQTQECEAVDKSQSYCHSESQAHHSATEVIETACCCPQQKQCVLCLQTRNPDYPSEIFWIKQPLLVQTYRIKISL